MLGGAGRFWSWRCVDGADFTEEMMMSMMGRLRKVWESMNSGFSWLCMITGTGFHHFRMRNSSWLRFAINSVCHPSLLSARAFFDLARCRRELCLKTTSTRLLRSSARDISFWAPRRLCASWNPCAWSYGDDAGSARMSPYPFRCPRSSQA